MCVQPQLAACMDQWQADNMPQLYTNPISYVHSGTAEQPWMQTIGAQGR